MQIIFAFIDQCEWFDWFFGAVAISLSVGYICKLISEHNERKSKKGYLKPKRRMDIFSELYTRKDRFL
jgi:hypothetical protein